MRGPILVLALAITASACVTTSNLQSATGTLESRTQRFYEEVRRDRTDEHLVRDAEALAAAADDLNRAVERREARDQLNDDFDRVAGHYHHLRDYYDGRGRNHDHDDADHHHHDVGHGDRFAAVSEAYLEVEGALRYRETRHADADDRRRY